MLTGLLLSAIIYHVLNGYSSQNKNKAKFKGGSRNMKKTNRFIALLTALVLVFSTLIGSTAFAAVNSDVAGTDFEEAVGKLQAVGVMQGYPDGTFLPNGEITRAEFAKIAVVALGLGDAAEASKGTTKFPDVAASHWAAGYVNLAASRGLITGYPDGTYKPEGKLTNAEAITILCRLVGLGPVIDKEGTWPANYVGRAANEGILDGVSVAAGTNATRGFVAEMLVNTLTVDMWGASGYGDDGSVDYGNLGETLLEDRLDITEADDVRVTDYDTDDNELVLDDPDNDLDGTFEVTTDVDLYEGYLNEVTVWVNSDDEVIFIDVTSTFYIDAIEFDEDALDLVGADKSFDIDMDDAVVYVEDDTDVEADTNAEILALDGNTYPLAKVVLNDKNDVIYVDAYDFDEFIVVESVDGDVVTDVEDEEFDFEDYTIFKNGMLVTAADMVKGDIVTFDNTTEFAEVYTKSVTGAVTDTFDGTIEVANEEYDYDASDVSVIYYVDEDGDFVVLDNDAAEQFEDEEGDVSVFLDRAGNALFITGDLGVADTSTVAGVIAEAGAIYETSKVYLEVTFVNENDELVTVDFKANDLDKVDDVDVEDAAISINLAGDTVTFNNATGTDPVITEAMLARGEVVEFVYDEAGAIVELNFLSQDALETTSYDLDIDDSYADLDTVATNQKLQSGTVVFVVDDLTADFDEDDVTIYVWGDVEDEFETISDGTVYYDDGKVEYIVADDANVDDDPDTTDFFGLITSFKTNTAADKVTRLEAWVDGTEKTYTVDDLAITFSSGTAYVLEVEDSTGVILSVTAADDSDNIVVDVDTIDVSDKTFSDESSNNYELVSGATIIDITDGLTSGEELEIRDLADLTENFNDVTVYYDEANTEFIIMVVVNDSNTTP